VAGTQEFSSVHNSRLFVSFREEIRRARRLQPRRMWSLYLIKPARSGGSQIAEEVEWGVTKKISIARSAFQGHESGIVALAAVAKRQGSGQSLGMECSSALTDDAAAVSGLELVCDSASRLSLRATHCRFCVKFYCGWDCSSVGILRYLVLCLEGNKQRLGGGQTARRVSS
jgi:hypothetical protein